MTPDQITARTLRSVEWKPVYKYDSGVQMSGKSYFSFTTYASDKLPGVTITKERRGVKRPRTTTIYQFQGRKTDSPTQLVRYWNEAARAAKSGGPAPPGGVESLRRSRRGAGV